MDKPSGSLSAARGKTVPAMPSRLMMACRVAPDETMAGASGGVMHLIADETSDKAAVEDFAERAGLGVIFRMASVDELESALEAVHRMSVCSQGESVGTMALGEEAAKYKVEIRQHYVEAIVARAVSEGASDIHIQPASNTLEIRFRVDGVLHTVERLNAAASSPLVAQIKVLSRLPIAEKRLPHDGRFSVNINGGKVDLRVSIVPSIHGEAAVLRIEGSDAPQSLDDLMMPREVRESVDSLLALRGGLVIVGGPTGSGKTTTLYAMMRRLADGSRKLLSVEDPVERMIPGVLQVPVEQGGMDFSGSIRAMLRHAPDVILVGEVRDGATASAATEAALTGHLVLASAHARDAVEVAVRMIELGVPRSVLSYVLEGAITQRLVRVLCPKCARFALPAPPLVRALGLLPEDFAHCRESVGCPACKGTGFSGRRAVFGLILMREALRRAIVGGEGAHALRKTADDLGMPSLLSHARQLVKEGVTSAAEALAGASLNEVADAD
jgi:general secretion pathway protein E